MKIKLLCIGKTSFEFVDEGNKLYQNRLKHFVQFEMITIPDLKNTKNMPVEEIKSKESALLLKNIGTGDKLCLLDEKGSSYTSEKFAGFIGQQLETGVKQLIFVIGGAYGFSEEVYKRANHQISLSKMTFSHQIIRLFFHEQIYRAFTIINGIPYHNQ